MMEKAISDHKLRLIEGNLALVEADAVVNAANKSLILGGGVAGAIRRCSDIMLRTAIQFLGSNQLPSEVIFCLYGNDAYEVFAETLDRLTASNRI
jgi:O-acetyl-ADP-ribose deacetylase (regulator of RNase III)